VHKDISAAKMCKFPEQFLIKLLAVTYDASGAVGHGEKLIQTAFQQ
jgi:hypothetical protein